MLSYNQIIGINREFANKHFVLKNFGNGQAWKITQHNQKSSFKYPIMWMEDLPSSSPNKIFALTFRVHFLGKVSDLKKREDDLMTTNENEVKSDMIQCAQDLISFWVQDTIYPALTIGRNFNITTLENELDDDVTGCYVDITFSQSNSYNSCIIPMSGIPTPPSVVCEPVTIKVNGEDYATVPSGQEKDVLVQYENGDSVGVIDGDIIKIPNPITCAPADVTLNGDEFATVESGGTLPVTVEYETSLDNPIASVSGSNIIIVDPVVVETPIIYLRPIGTGLLTSYADGDDYWKVLNEVDTYVPPTVGKPALLDKAKMWKLVSDNIYGHKFRYTSSIGGYYDPETDTYHLADGTLSIKATAFPNDYRIDHHTGIGWVNNFYNLPWADCFTFLDGYANSGYSDYFVPNLRELQTLPDYGKNWQFYNSAPFDNTGPANKWTSTTNNYTTTNAFIIGIQGDVGITTKTSPRYLVPMRYHFI